MYFEIWKKVPVFIGNINISNFLFLKSCLNENLTQNTQKTLQKMNLNDFAELKENV